MTDTTTTAVTPATDVINPCPRCGIPFSELAAPAGHYYMCLIGLAKERDAAEAERDDAEYRAAQALHTLAERDATIARMTEALEECTGPCSGQHPRIARAALEDK